MPAKTRADANRQQREWYRRNRQKHIATVRNREIAVSAWFREFKKTLKCKCGESDPRCLDFHHRDRATKVCNVADGVRRGLTMAKLVAEIAKCDVLCANCHRKHEIPER